MGNVELSIWVGQAYILPSYVCWKYQGNRIHAVDDWLKNIANTIHFFYAHPVFTRHSLSLNSSLMSGNWKFSISAWSWLFSVWLFWKVNDKTYKFPAHSSSAQKESGENTVRKESLSKWKKKKVTQVPLKSPVPWSLISQGTLLCHALLKSPTCALHMLLPGASETKLSYATLFRDKKDVRA